MDILEKSNVNNYNNNFLNQFGNKLISIESLATPNNYLTAVETNLLFETRINSNKLDLNNCFIVKIDRTSNSYPTIYLQSPVNNYVITIDNNDVFLMEPKSKSSYNSQHFYPLDPMNLSNDPNNLSLQLINSKSKLHATFSNKILRGVPKSIDASNLNNGTFKVREVSNLMTIRFISIDNKIMVSYASGNVVLNKGKLSKATKYIITPVVENRSSLLGDYFYLKNRKTGKNLMVDESGYLNEKTMTEDADKENYKFILIDENGFFVIENQKQYINQVNNQLMLKDKSKSIGIKKLFKIKVNYELL